MNIYLDSFIETSYTVLQCEPCTGFRGYEIIWFQHVTVTVTALQQDDAFHNHHLRCRGLLMLHYTIVLWPPPWGGGRGGRRGSLHSFEC